MKYIKNNKKISKKKYHSHLSRINKMEYILLDINFNI